MPKRTFLLLPVFFLLFCLDCFASSVKEPEFGNKFYPDQKEELSGMIDGFLDKANPCPESEMISVLISPHAGYGFSGQTAAFGYKSIKNKNYKTVIVLGTSHHSVFTGAAVWNQGNFVTSLGRIAIDHEFIKNILDKDPEVFQSAPLFNQEHSVEVQLPFLQKVLPGYRQGLSNKEGSDYPWKIVPVIIGDCSLETCKKIALLFKEAIGKREDVLLVVSSDLYHGYDFKEAEQTDEFTLELIKKMDYQGLYYALRDSRAQACGGFAIVIALNIAKDLGSQRIQVLAHTNSALATGRSVRGDWTVGYASCAVFSPVPAVRVYEDLPGSLNKQGENMLTLKQKRELLKIARDSISVYLRTGKKSAVATSEPELNQKKGAFVTLNLHNELRGCIGNLVANQPLYLTISDMALEAAFDDPRFSRLTLSELDQVKIDISVLSPLEKVTSADKIQLGKHGVLVRRGNQSGVFLPQVATETGWSKEEFLNNLCAHKAGIAKDAWKNKDTELYIFTADVFSEQDIKNSD